MGVNDPILVNGDVPLDEAITILADAINQIAMIVEEFMFRGLFRSSTDVRIRTAEYQQILWQERENIAKLLQE